MVTIEVRTRSENSFKLRHYLSKHGFVVYVTNPLTNSLMAISEPDYFGSSSNDHTIYSCIYNERTLPSREVLRRINNDPSVISFTFCKA